MGLEYLWSYLANDLQGTRKTLISRICVCVYIYIYIYEHLKINKDPLKKNEELRKRLFASFDKDLT